MKALISELRTAILATLTLALVCCGLYPLAVWALGQALFPRQANGSLIEAKDGRVVGSALLGQSFHSAKYFFSRPSAAGQGYDGTSSGGSNLGPTSRALHTAIQERVRAYRTKHGLQDHESVPADAVTASASGLDPHISLRNAECQAQRVAKARHLSPEQVRSLIHPCAEPPWLGCLGETGVNVLRLNLALDHL